jgi:putative Ca2+/H+ antiporter (TMEM165/GDT1 family)
MDVVRRFAAAGLAEAARKARHRRRHLVIGAVDETGQEKAGAAVVALAIVGGRRLQRILPLRWIARLAALAMVVMAGLTLAEALR